MMVRTGTEEIGCDDADDDENAAEISDDAGERGACGV